MPPLNPKSIAPPFAAYSHGFIVPAGKRLIVTSGQLGLQKDGVTPKGAQAQAAVCFGNIDAILQDAGAAVADVIKLTSYVTDRAHMAGYMAARDAWLGDVAEPPASTLVIVSGFTRPEFVVEIEVMAMVDI